MKDQIEKQTIKEMAKVIEVTEQIARDAHCGLPSPTMYAKDLYWHGYRKPSKGEWRTTLYDENYPAFFAYYHACNKCAYVYYDVRTFGYNYCPNCGAHMKGGRK